MSVSVVIAARLPSNAGLRFAGLLNSGISAERQETNGDRI